MGRSRDRRRHIAAATRKDMYVLAGLPHVTHRKAADFLEARVGGAIVHAIPAPAGNGALYPAKHIDTLVRTVGEFAVRRRVNGPDRPATPATITLLYVPAADQELLLRAFDFAVLAMPLAALVAYDQRGQQLRYDLETVQDVIAGLAAPDSEMRAAREAIGFRISRYVRSDEGLLLPPRNFLVGDGDLVSLFRSMRTGTRSWQDRFPELGPDQLTHDDLPMRVPANKTLRVFVDDRGMAFPVAHPAAFDGPPREVEEDATQADILSALRSLYRFGGALPRGFHHDAQRADGSHLGGAILHCEQKGEISAQGDYANVYPNDFVRTQT